MPKFAIFKGRFSFTRNGRIIFETVGDKGGTVTYEYPTVAMAKASMEYARISGKMLPGYKK